MNQILSTNDKKRSTALGLKPIVRFFAIMLVIMALIFGGQAGYKLFKSNKDKTDFPKAELKTEQFGSVLNLKFKDEIRMKKIEYSWNDGNITEIEKNGENNIEIDIDVPNGENTLHVAVIDVENNKTKFEAFKVSYTEGDIIYEKDRKDPTVSVESSGTAKKFKIIAKDDKELDYVSYNWENEEPTVVKATEDTKLEIVEEVAIQHKGTKDIFIKVVDKAGNKVEKNMHIIGSEGPKVRASLKDNNIVIKVTSENKITRIVYTHNDVEHEVENIPEDAKEFEFLVPLQDGENKVKVNAYENEIMTEYKCKKTK